MQGAVTVFSKRVCALRCVALPCLQAYSKIRNAVMHGMEVDIHKAVEEDPIVAAMWVPTYLVAVHSN